MQHSSLFSLPEPGAWTTVLVLALSVVSASAQLSDQAAHLRFDPVNCGCSVIRSPEKESRNIGGDFAFRRSGSGALLVARSPASGSPYVFFEVSATQPPRVTPIGKAQWDSAKHTGWQVAMNSLLSRASPTAIRQVESVSFLGHEYRRGGEHWANVHVAALPSPDKSLLVVQSYSGGYLTDEPKLGGKIFIDIYSTDSGTRLCRVEGTHQAYNGSDFLNNTIWTANRELVANPDPVLHHQLLYCDFNSASAKN